MSDALESDPRAIAGSQYLVDLTRPLPDAGGGIPAFTVIGRRASAVPLMALRVDRHAPGRPRALQAPFPAIDGLLTPLAHGIGPPIEGNPAYYVVCQAPPGPPLSAAVRPWLEPALIELVLRPIAVVLEQLQSRGITHRAIRPNNVFQAGSNHPVTLGAAWAAPPAMHQPAVCETAYTAVCHPSARGDGRIADDVYALGVLLVTLALGRTALDGLDDQTIMFRKSEQGDFAAITGNERLPPILGDIIRGMLAEDPDHRPTPALLRDPVAARGRRVAARPPARAQRPMKFGTMIIWNNRAMALAMALEPGEALTVIQSGALMYWLRRGLGDSTLAVKLEELVRQHTLDAPAEKEVAAATLVMRAIADTDIFMPLCWRGLALFPDGLGPALATDQRTEFDLHRKLQEIVLTEAQGTWAAMREEREPSPPHRLEARQRRAIVQIRGSAGGLPRLAYTLNPQIPCASTLLGRQWISNVQELAPALDAIAAASPDADLLEPQIAAFIGARSERWLDREVKALAMDGDAAARTLIALRMLTELQVRYHPAPMKGLTAWIAERAQPLVERWKNRERRAAVQEQMKALVAAGFLRPMRALLEDAAEQAADTEGLRVAESSLAQLDAELLAITDGGARRSAQAARLGQEIAAGIGLAAIAATLILAAMG
jgi:eukaryotic-like serine/threonine-protein kinase